MNTKRYLALVMALVMAFSLVVPVSAAPTVQPLVCGDTELHDTARLTVYVNNDDNPAAVGSIDSDMNAKLVLNYRDYSAASTVTVAGQTENHANQTTFTLNGSNHSGINLDESYFPGFGRLTDSNGYTIKFVDELGTSSNNYWGYTFKKSNEPNDGVTLELVTDTPDEADAHWQTLKGEAFNETHENDENSFIKLAAGSYLQMANEKLTVNSDLWLDDFSNEGRVDYNVTNAKAKLTYTTPSTTAYQLLLKEGTQFSLGCSMAEVVNQDLLITMSNVTKSYTDPILRNVYNNLTPETEEALAQNLLKVFSEIAGLARPLDTAKPVKITFGTPTTSTTTTTDTGSETVEKTTTTIVTGNSAGTTNTTTVATENTTTVNTSAKTTTVVSKVTETSSAVEQTQSSSEQLTYAVTYSGQVTTTTTLYDEDGAHTYEPVVTPIPTSPQKTVTITAVAEDSSKVLDAIGNKAKVGTPLLNNVADDALAAIVTEAVTAAQTDQSVESISVKIVIEAEAKSADNATVKEYEVTPKAYTYVNTATTPTSVVEITNENLASNAQFTITLPVPNDLVNGTKKVTVTHTSDDYPEETFIADVLGKAGKYYVTFQTSHFSVFSISANSSVSHVDDVSTFVKAQNDGYNFVDTVYLNAQDTIYMNIVVFVSDHFDVTESQRDDGKYIHVTYDGTSLGKNIYLKDIPLMSAEEANGVEKDMKKALVYPGYWCYCDELTTGNSNGFYTIRIPVYPNHMDRVMTVSLYNDSGLMTLYQNAGTSVFTNTGVTFGAASVDLYTVKDNVYQQTTYNYLSWLKNNGSVEYQNIANAMIAYGQAAANITQWNS